MSRQQIVKTPGKVTIDPIGENVDLYSSDPISLELNEETVELKTDRDGTYDQVVVGKLVIGKIRPTQFTAAALAAIFKHGALRMGSSIVSGTDKPWDIHTVDGVRRRLACAFVQGEPAIKCKAGETLMGELTFYGILASGGDSAELNSYYARSNVAFSDASWNPEHELTPGWVASFSKGTASAWDDMDLVDGMTITPKSVLDDDKPDSKGLINTTISDYSVEAAASVLNISEELLIEATGMNLRIGAKRSSLGRTLKMRANDGSAFIYLPRAVLQPNYGLNFDAKKTVVGDLKWRSFPAYAGGALGGRLLVTTTDPDEEE